jgi:hypothetical protein
VDITQNERFWSCDTVLLGAAICCIYSKVPPDDEQLIYSKHVGDGY